MFFSSVLRNLRAAHVGLLLGLATLLATLLTSSVAYAQEAVGSDATATAAVEQGMWGRLFAGNANGLDVFLLVCTLALLAAFIYIVWSYARGLRGSPRELYLMFFTKVTEYSAYGAAQMAFVLYLHKDVGLSDLGAGSYIGLWSVLLTAIMMVVGAVCDSIGIKKTLLVGCYLLLFSRAMMPLFNNIWLVSLLGFVPMAAGIAITGPVLSVGIKRYTTKEGAALGFGLFYTMMNVGWAIGGWIFDFVRGQLGEHEMYAVPGIGLEMSTYQVIFAVGFFLTLPDLLAITFIREGVSMTDDGIKYGKPEVTLGGGSLIGKLFDFSKQTASDTARQLSSVFREKAFWIFMFMIGSLVFVKLVFYHFHYTFPTYGIRLFGEGAKVGNIYGVLNPMMIVFLVPLIAAATKSIKSYKMLLLGTAISSGAVFIATIPPETFIPLIDTWFGELIYERWLDVAPGQRDPFYLALIFFITFFTLGEAIWSPRLMQFTAEIAPEGKEGTYIALSYLPYFGAKFIAGPMSGLLISTYIPEGQASYPDHYMIWVWIGFMASLSPAALIIFRRLYIRGYQ